MCSIFNKADFDRELVNQQQDVQKNINHYFKSKCIEKAEHKKLLERIDKRGKEIRGYYRKCNGLG